MKRPIDPENLKYALLDVAYLMDLENILVEKVKEKKLLKNVEKRMKHVTSVKEPEPGWMRIGSWRHYNEKQRILVKNIYIARDRIAKRFNVPASRVLDKHTIIDLVLNPPVKDEDVSKRLSGQNPRFIAFLVPSMVETIKKSRQV